MQKHQLYINLLTLTSALAFSACVEEVVYVVNPDVPEVGEKTPIELSASSRSSVGDNRQITRAVIIDGKGKVTAFEKDTRIHMLYLSEDGSSTSDLKPSKWTVTYGLAKGSGTAPADLAVSESSWTEAQKYSAISFDGTRRSSQTYEDPANEITGSKTSTDDNAYEGSWRYWDDAYARNAQVSVYGVCVANTILPNGAPWNQKISGVASNATPTWNSSTSIDYAIGREDGSSKAKWTIGKYDGSNNFNSQSFLSVLYKDDLCYSNNLEGDFKLKYNTDTSSPNYHKFDKGKLVFHRAMSLITIKLNMGVGYTTSDFKFDTNKNIKMQGFNKAGYLNIKTGEWSDVEIGGWNTICNATASSDSYFTLMAFVIPGNDLKAAVDATNNPKEALIISIGGNEYKISKLDLYNAIKANPNNVSGVEVKSDYLVDGTKLKAGINYEFNFTIGKKGIDAISAQIIDWQTVTADIKPSNATGIKLQLEERGATVASAVDIYRATNSASNYDELVSYNWTTGYTETNNKNVYKEIDSTWKLENTWFWPNNLTYYHFRAIMPSGQTVTKDNTGGDYVSLSSGSTYTDVLWGAPMRDDGDNTDAGSFQWSYDLENGFNKTNSSLSDKNQIYQAIGATEDQIKLTLFHMMSDLTINIKTTSTEDKVTLVDGSDNKTKVNIIGCSPTGKVLLGNGLVVPGLRDDSDVLTEPVAWKTESPTGTHVYKYGIVPQNLTGVQLYITTPDNNQYIVNLADIKATTVTTNNIVNPYTQTDGKYVINSWYPGFEYTYNLTLKKKGITDITATVVNWETVNTDNEDVTIQ